jgi:excisionase family DNA binding protein
MDRKNALAREQALLLNQREAAQLLGVSFRTIDRLRKVGSLVPVRLEGLGHPRYRRSDLEAFIAEAERAP